MTARKNGTLFAAIMGVLVILLLLATMAGCGSKEGGEPGAVKGGEEAKRAEPSAEAQPKEYVFSATVSEDTKTDTFQVSTSSQVLHYNLIGGEKAGVTITIFSYPDGKMQAGAYAFEPGPHQKTIYLTPGTYYMEILPDDCTVEVKVED